MKYIHKYCFSIIILIFLFSTLKCTTHENKKTEEYNDYKRRIIHKRKEIEAFMERNAESPFRGEIAFNGLNYFQIDSSYNVKAKVTYLNNTEIITMKTSDDKNKEYTKLCQLSFRLKDKYFTLYAYKSTELIDNELFIPFLDNSNGKTTYIKGRYLKAIPLPSEKNIVQLDFNLSYFPYCAYNHKYSCIIPPKENYMNTNINAGEKSK